MLPFDRADRGTIGDLVESLVRSEFVHGGQADENKEYIGAAAAKCPGALAQSAHH